MQMQEYRARYDSLAVEGAWFDVPFRKEWVLKQIGRGRRVLDIGCLGGQFSQLMVAQNNEVWGVELNARAAKLAQKRGIRVKIADVEQGLPFEAGSFDVVHAGNILESLYDTHQFFEECARVLSPQGVLLFSTTNLNSLENRIRVATGGYLTMAGAFPEDHFGDHIRQFNLDKLRELCERSGFELEETFGVPVLQSQGRWIDLGLAALGKAFPEFSKLLIVRARKIGRA